MPPQLCGGPSDRKCLPTPKPGAVPRAGMRCPVGAGVHPGIPPCPGCAPPLGRENLHLTPTREINLITYQVIRGRGNVPVAHVSWFDAARFTNWLPNGGTFGQHAMSAWTPGQLRAVVLMTNRVPPLWHLLLRTQKLETLPEHYLGQARIRARSHRDSGGSHCRSSSPAAEDSRG